MFIICHLQASAATVQTVWGAVAVALADIRVKMNRELLEG